MLRDIRVSRGMTMKGLSRVSGVPYRTVQGWELDGKGQSTLRTAKKLAKALGCTIEDLVEED